MVSDLVLCIVLIVLSCVWGYIGIFELGLWIPGISADSGFIPTVFSAVTLICAVILLIQTLKKGRGDAASAEKASAEAPAGAASAVLAFVKKYGIILFAVAGALCLEYLGLAPMCFLLVFGWLKLMNKFSWVKSIAIAAIVTVAIYLIFVQWLQIPFPGLI